MGQRRREAEDELKVPLTVRVGVREAREIAKLLESGKWLQASEFIHEAVREKVHKEKMKRRYGGT